MRCNIIAFIVRNIPSRSCTAGGTSHDASPAAHRGPLADSMSMAEAVVGAVWLALIALACARWRTIEFCKKYDGAAFDPAYPTRPLEDFAKPLHSPCGLTPT